MHVSQSPPRRRAGDWRWLQGWRPRTSWPLPARVSSSSKHAIVSAAALDESNLARFANRPGRSWIHGHLGNPMTELAERFGVPTKVTDFNSVAPFGADGHGFTPQESTRLLRISVTSLTGCAIEA